MISLVLMADYFADPIWRRSSDPEDAADCGMINLDSLPLSTDLKDRLRAWARRHDDELLGTEECQWTCADAQAEWIAQGRTLLHELRRELGPDHEITYHHGRD